jgi:hypothetical protein
MESDGEEMMEIAGPGYRLSSGKVIYSNRNIIGISPTEEGLFEGYDGELHACLTEEQMDNFSNLEDIGDNLTDKEKVEIADYALILWSQYKKKYERQ